MKVVGHVHTSYSDGLMLPSDYPEMYPDADTIIIADHRRILPSLKAVQKMPDKFQYVAVEIDVSDINGYLEKVSFPYPLDGDNQRDRAHMTLIAYTQKGLKNLLEIEAEIYRNNKRGYAPLENVFAFSFEGIMVGTGCYASFIRKSIGIYRQLPTAEEALSWWRRHIEGKGGVLVGEVFPFDPPEILSFFQRNLDYYMSSYDTHTSEADIDVWAALIAGRSQQFPWNARMLELAGISYDPRKKIFYPTQHFEGYIQHTDHWLKKSKIPVAEKISTGNEVLNVPELKSEYYRLYERATQNLRTSDDKKLLEELRREHGLITKNGFETLISLAALVINDILNKGQVVCIRGSASSSRFLYGLFGNTPNYIAPANIRDLDSRRFMREGAKVAPPDVDIDVPNRDILEPVVKEIASRYDLHTARVGTVITLGLVPYAKSIISYINPAKGSALYKQKISEEYALELLHQYLHPDLLKKTANVLEKGYIGNYGKHAAGIFFMPRDFPIGDDLYDMDIYGLAAKVDLLTVQTLEPLTVWYQTHGELPKVEIEGKLKPYFYNTVPHAGSYYSGSILSYAQREKEHVTFDDVLLGITCVRPGVRAAQEMLNVICNSSSLQAEINMRHQYLAPTKGRTSTDKNYWFQEDLYQEVFDSMQKHGHDIVTSSEIAGQAMKLASKKKPDKLRSLLEKYIPDNPDIIERAIASAEYLFNKAHASSYATVASLYLRLYSSETPREDMLSVLSEMWNIKIDNISRDENRLALSSMLMSLGMLQTYVEFYLYSQRRTAKFVAALYGRQKEKNAIGQFLAHRRVNTKKDQERIAKAVDNLLALPEPNKSEEWIKKAEKSILAYRKAESDTLGFEMVYPYAVGWMFGHMHPPKNKILPHNGCIIFYKNGKLQAMITPHYSLKVWQKVDPFTYVVGVPRADLYRTFTTKSKFLLYGLFWKIVKKSFTYTWGEKEKQMSLNLGALQ